MPQSKSRTTRFVARLQSRCSQETMRRSYQFLISLRFSLGYLGDETKCRGARVYSIGSRNESCSSELSLRDYFLRRRAAAYESGRAIRDAYSAGQSGRGADKRLGEGSCPER